jgi:hypothetical protein
MKMSYKWVRSVFETESAMIFKRLKNVGIFEAVSAICV